jgi:predicted ATPase
MPVWYAPADAAAAAAALDAAWRRLAGGNGGAPQELPLKGRFVRVPQAAMGMARFSFRDLCEEPLAAADYLRIAHEYHTVILDRLPVLTFERRNAAKRFIILIDTLYDLNVKLIASAEAEPEALYRAIRASRPRSSSAPLRVSSRCARKPTLSSRTAPPMRDFPAHPPGSSRPERWLPRNPGRARLEYARRKG